MYDLLKCIPIILLILLYINSFNFPSS